MASKIKKGLETANIAYARALGRAQVAVDAILWGKAAVTKVSKPDDRTQTIEQRNNTAGKKQQSKIVKAAKQKTKRLLDKGLFPVLDDLLAADLCNIITYLYSQAAKPTNKRSESPTKIERNLYFLQDQALAIQKAIDTFTTYPDRLIGRFLDGGGFDPISQDLAKAQSNPTTVATSAQTPNPTQPSQDIAGNQARKFNLVNLVTYIQSALSDITTVKDIQGVVILEPADKELLTSIPQLQSTFNFLNDVISSISTYTDYRNISNEEFQKALKTLNKIRSICVLIQNLSIKDPTALLNAVPPTAVQAQLRNLQESIDLTDLVPLIKKISTAVKSFTSSAQVAQGIVEKGQFIIKIAIVLIRTLKGLILGLRALAAAIASVLTTAGTPVETSLRITKLDVIINDLITILGQVNQLLSTTIYYIRYLQANARTLSVKLDTLLATLLACDAIKDSPILQDLQETNNELKNLETTLQALLNRYDNSTNAKKVTFGAYTIEVIDEEVVDEGITNRRRRGIALDNRGVLVLQSDLTFATDLAIIIQEVKVKLVAAGLVQPGLGSIDPNITVITESLSFLQENDLIAEDLNLENDLIAEDLNLEIEQDNELGSFVDGLRGGKKLRRRVRARTAAIKSKLKNNLNIENSRAAVVFRPQQQTTPPVGSLSNYEVQIYESGVVKRIYNTSAASIDDAIKQAKNKIDPNGYYPNWKYVAKKVG